jgi:hypothetical protein
VPSPQDLFLRLPGASVERRRWGIRGSWHAELGGSSIVSLK